MFFLSRPRLKNDPKVGKLLEAPLPDFSWYKIPKREKLPNNHKYSKWPKSIPNGCKMFQLIIKYTGIFHCKALQNISALGFLVKKTPSGNPGCRKQEFFGSKKLFSPN
jgi:hypothetical protein